MVVVAALAVAGGGGAAVAATQGGGADQREAFLNSVAKHLGVTPQALKDATKAAALEQVDAALAAGRITKAQADEIKARINSGDVPFLGPGFGRHGPGPGLHAREGKLTAAAKYLGLSVDALATKLRGGDTLAEVAKAQGKSADGLEQAILADLEGKLDDAVKDGRLTDAQRKEMLARAKERIDDLVNGRLPERHGPRLRPRGGLFGP